MHLYQAPLVWVVMTLAYTVQDTLNIALANIRGQLVNSNMLFDPTIYIFGPESGYTTKVQASFLILSQP